MGRLYGDKVEIERDAVKNFFNKRASKDGDSNIKKTEFSDDEVSIKRHEIEIRLLLDLIDFSGKKVLDIGCGTGRWAEVSHDKCESYLGVDLSDKFIDIANETYHYDNCEFQVVAAHEIYHKSNIKPPFDVVIFCGVIMYFNEEDIVETFQALNNLLSDNAQLYIRESISYMDVRLTLKDFYSDNLEDDYNVIYRTKDELMEHFSILDNMKVVKSENLFEDLKSYSETGYRYFYLEKE